MPVAINKTWMITFKECCQSLSRIRVVLWYRYRLPYRRTGTYSTFLAHNLSTALFLLRSLDMISAKQFLASTLPLKPYNARPNKAFSGWRPREASETRKIAINRWSSLQRHHEHQSSLFSEFFKKIYFKFTGTAKNHSKSTQFLGLCSTQSLVVILGQTAHIITVIVLLSIGFTD